MASNQSNAFPAILDFEQRLGFVFSDKSLLLRALTHRSYLNETAIVYADNERLEFLGDAVLDLIVAELLYQRFPEQHEGFLTALRARLVRRETLAQFARQLDLGPLLLMGKGEEDGGGRERDAILCAAFEALVGATYLDQGLSATAAFLIPFVRPDIDLVSDGQLHKDPKSLLQEWSQAELNATPTYITTASEGPDHARAFTVEVRIAGVTYGVGKGQSKQRAAQEAARAALAGTQGRKEAPTPDL